MQGGDPAIGARLLTSTTTMSVLLYSSEAVNARGFDIRVSVPSGTGTFSLLLQNYEYYAY